MKPLHMILTMSFVLATSAALAQGQSDACSKQYGACMDHCAGRPQTVQATCSQTCEANTNRCYVGMYGPAPSEGAGSQAAVSQPARDAQGSAAPAQAPAAAPAPAQPESK